MEKIVKNTYILFRSRSELYSFANILKSYGVCYGIVGTPHSLTVSCSLAVRINQQDLAICKNILSRRYFATFTNIFEITESSNNPAVIRKIY